jgi:hypothetical protein
MEKKLLKEINEIRSIMGLSLITETIVDDIGKLFLNILKKAETDTIIIKGLVQPKTVKEIFETLIKGFDTLPAKEQKAVIKFMGTKEGKAFLTAYEGALAAYKKSPNFDKLTYIAYNRQAKLIKDELVKLANSKSGSGSLPNPSGGSTKILFQTYDEALKYFESVVNSLGGEFPNVFKNTKVGRSTMESAARMSVGKTEQEAFDFLRKSFAEKELVLKDMPSWYQQLFKKTWPYLDPFLVSRNLNGKVNPLKTAAKAPSSIVAGLFIMSFFTRVGKEIGGYEDNTQDLWQKILVAGFKMVGIAIPTFLEAGKQGFEKGKDEYNRNQNTRNDRDQNNKKPRDEKPRDEKSKEEKPKTPDNTTAKGGDLDKL